MNESKWRSCNNTVRMIKYLRYRVTNRKLRLYFCGGCRYISHLFFSPLSFTAIEVAERFADKNATQEELDRASWAAESPTFGIEFIKDHDSSLKKDALPRFVEMGIMPESVLSGCQFEVDDIVRDRLLAAASLAEYTASPDLGSNWGLKHFWKVDWPSRWLFDCVFGNPFRPVTIDPSWLTSTAVALASAIYKERAFDRSPILADALQDAGCENQLILNHLRRPGPHVLGCWGVDLVLGYM